MEKIKELIAYGFFGICSTIVNIVVYWIFAYPFHIKTVPSTIVAWITAVAFAYVTNRIWVFQSKTSGFIQIAKEAGSFFFCRLLTGAIDLLLMWFFVDVRGSNDVLIKSLANVIVIILNYVASKVYVFRK